MNEINFNRAFEQLTGNKPFPWQRDLYQSWFSHGTFPDACIVPTGLGKTAVVAIWLIALAKSPRQVPRRLVYVVNRRTVVDQTTTEAERLRDRAGAVGLPVPAISTLRGQFADNREWSADPSRPAIICGTVDMIGSRLLFSGYGVGWKSRPLHAGFLGQDVLLVHDEAHLEPAFQSLIESIRKEQQRCREFRPLRVMALTATSRGDGGVFGLTDEDRAHPVVKERINATKKLHLHPLDEPRKKLAEQLAAKAKEFDSRNRAVLVFARTVPDVLAVADKLPKDRVVTLTGTMRGKERDALVEHPLFQRFLPGGQSDAPTTYLVCTAAGEVGVNISADDLVCDLTPFDSMAQRFGRVNRFGKRDDTEIHVFHPKEEEFEKDKYDQACARTLELLGRLNGDASPSALAALMAARTQPERDAAFTPKPTILPATDILFDAWALTSIRDKLPGRPAVEPYLHGIADWQPPETHVAWRQEVDEIQGELLKQYPPTDLLDAYPLKPHELLREPSQRAFEHFEAMAKRLNARNVPVWLLDDAGAIEVLTLADLANKENKEQLNGKTVLLPPSAGGLNRNGMLDGKADPPAEGSLDVADTPERLRVWTDDEQFDTKTKGLHSVLTITFPSEDEDADEKTWQWFVWRSEGEPSAARPVLWQVHVDDVVKQAEAIVERLSLDEGLKQAIVTAAKLHDHGKRRRLFQQVLGNGKYPDRILAKSGKTGGRVKETYRHEFGSLLDVEKELSGEHRDLILHLIAAHHGRARPHFPLEEAFDPERPQADAERLAADVPRRFARLQRKYGRWGLAYLESLLRAADYAASANPSDFVKDQP